MKENEYQCAMCKGIFEKGWTEEESVSELKENFGDISKEDCDVICDDCYNAIMIGGKPIVFN